MRKTIRLQKFNQCNSVLHWIIEWAAFNKLHNTKKIDYLKKSNIEENRKKY